jgi:hypothetical protein
LSLYVISRAGFDVRCGWPGRESEGDAEGAVSATEVPKGHSMSYVDSLETLLLRMIVLFIFPTWLIGEFLQSQLFFYGLTDASQITLRSRTPARQRHRFSNGVNI